MRRPQPILVLVGLFFLLAIGAQVVPFYTDWLWFGEVGYTGVFWTTLSLRGALFTAVMVGVLVFLAANLMFAARTAAPDVLWELEDQLGLPGRVVIEPLIRRFLPIVLLLIAIVSGLRASVHWEIVLGYQNAEPFGATDPVFGQDLGFFVFVLPFWRMIHGWALALAAGTMLLTLVLYGLQRSLVLTTRGPRIAAGARTHLLLLGALLLLLKAVGFWLDRFEIVFSERGFIFGAAYTDVYATLPALGGLALLARAGRRRLRGPDRAARPLPGRLRPRAAGRGVGRGPRRLPGAAPALPGVAQRAGGRATRSSSTTSGSRGPPTAWIASRRRSSRPTRRSTRGRSTRNETTIKNIRLWDYRPLLRTFGQLQEIRTYYKFVDVDNDRYLINGEYRQLMLSPRELSYQHLQGGRNWINEHLTYTHGYGVVVGPVTRITPEGLPEFFVKDIPPQSSGGFPAITRPEIYFGEIANEYVLVRTRSQEFDYPRGDQNVYARYAGTRRRADHVVAAAARLRGALRRAQDPPVRRHHRREPDPHVPRDRAADRAHRAVLPLRPRSLPRGQRRRPAGVDAGRLHHDRPLPVLRAGPGHAATTSATR